VTLLITSTEQDRITLPEWLLSALHLQAGQEVAAIVENGDLRFTVVQSPVNGSVDEPSVSESEALADLAAIVARIKILPKDPKNIEPATKTAAELLADLEANPPSKDLFTFAGWDQLWAQFEAEQKAFERADDIREGRL